MRGSHSACGLASVLSLGPAPAELIRKAAEKISKAKSPVIQLGMVSSDPDATSAVRALLKRAAQGISRLIG
jgi:thiamine pyrophosphate-dependent acetolactate synthase large subunit-like protein